MTAANDSNNDNNAPTPEAAAARAEFERTLGEVLLLLSGIPPYDNLFLHQIAARVVPPLVLRQYQITRTPEGLMVGYAAWAMVTPELAEHLSTDENAVDALQREDWNCGEEKVMIDEVGMTQEMMQQIKGQ